MGGYWKSLGGSLGLLGLRRSNGQSSERRRCYNFTRGIPRVEPTESKMTMVLELGDYEPHLPFTFSKSH